MCCWVVGKMALFKEKFNYNRLVSVIEFWQISHLLCVVFVDFVSRVRERRSEREGSAMMFIFNEWKCMGTDFLYHILTLVLYSKLEPSESSEDNREIRMRLKVFQTELVLNQRENMEVWFIVYYLCIFINFISYACFMGTRYMIVQRKLICKMKIVKNLNFQIDVKNA